MVSVRLARIFVSLLILVILIFVGCQRTGIAPEAENTGILIALQPQPLEETLVIILTDASGAPVTDATVAVEGNMNHAGMIPVLADPVADDADGNADGRYHLPFTFTMLGDWILTVTITQADGTSFSRNLDVRASSDGFTGDELMPEDEPESNAPDAGGGEETPAREIGVHDPMARPAPLAGGTGAVYFVFHNHGDTPVTLIGASSPAAAAVEIHTTINDNGVMRMRQITESIEIAPDGELTLTPGAMHLMLIDLGAPLVEGESVDVTLHFAETDDLTFTVPVVKMDDLPDDGENEHDH